MSVLSGSEITLFWQYKGSEFFLRFEVEEIPEKKKNAVGVRGMKLSDGDEIEAVFIRSRGMRRVWNTRAEHLF